MKIADLVREYMVEFKKKYAKRLLPGHHKALRAITTCRTPEAGLLIVECPQCHEYELRPLSCGNRHCPICQHHATEVWLERQLEKLLPVPYYLVTFTIPESLRATAWRRQRLFYNAMFEAGAFALQSLAREERFLGGELGFTGVLHTHSRRLGYHPHLHFVVPAGAFDPKTRYWKRKGDQFLFPSAKLAARFDQALLGKLKQDGIDLPLVPGKWVVNCRPVGTGEPALKYLSRYLYRGILSEKQLVSNENGQVTFRYRESGSKTWKTRTLAGPDFLWLLMQHVLPRGFRRVRDFGFLHGNAGKTLRSLQLLLQAKVPLREEPLRPAFRCPRCQTEMKFKGRLPGLRSSPGPP